MARLIADTNIIDNLFISHLVRHWPVRLEVRFHVVLQSKEHWAITAGAPETHRQEQHHTIS